jgi:type II secretory pathway pseudopilin PulG
VNLPLLAILAAAALVVASLAAVLVVTLSGRRRLERELDEARADVEALRARVEALARRDADGAEATTDPQEFVITTLEGAPTGRATAVVHAATDPGRATLPAGEFVTMAVGESLVRLLSLGYGVRRALSPESRNRIGFEMRREVRRSRRARRRDLKEAKRHVRAGQRADLAEDAA